MALTVDQTLGLGGGLNMTVGSWTATLNQADQTLALAGGQVYFHNFENQDGPSKGAWIPPMITTSVSGHIITLTLKAREAVTKGRFVIIHG